LRRGIATGTAIQATCHLRLHWFTMCASMRFVQLNQVYVPRNGYAGLVTRVGDVANSMGQHGGPWIHAHLLPAAACTGSAPIPDPKLSTGSEADPSRRCPPRERLAPLRSHRCRSTHPHAGGLLVPVVHRRAPPKRAMAFVPMDRVPRGNGARQCVDHLVPSSTMRMEPGFDDYDYGAQQRNPMAIATVGLRGARVSGTPHATFPDSVSP